MRLEEWQVPVESPGHFSAYSNNPHGEDNQNYLHFPMKMGLPGSSDGKEFACNAGDLSSTLESGRSPGGGHGNPLQFSGLENTHGQRSLAGYSPKGCKESDPTE